MQFRMVLARSSMQECISVAYSLRSLSNVETRNVQIKKDACLLCMPAKGSIVISSEKKLQFPMITNSERDLRKTIDSGSDAFAKTAVKPS